MEIPIFGKPVKYTLKVSGLWPDYFNILGFTLIMSSLFTLMPFQVLDVFNEFDNIFDVLDNMTHLIGEIMLYSKFLVIWYHRSVFNRLLREMNDYYASEYKIESWSKLISTSHRFAKFDYALYVGASGLHYLQFILGYSEIPEEREMILRAQYPFEFKTSPVYEIMTIIQIIQGLAMCSILALSESLIVALVLYTCGHIDLLSEKIDEFSLNCLNNQENISLEAIIKQHQRILNIVDNVETVYTYASFVQVFLSTFVLCCSGLIVLTISDNVVITIKFIMMGITAMWQGYAFCFFGQRLINKSDEISNKIYDTFWYYTNPETVRDISYIIKKAQTPLTLTAGKFTSLSAETFTAIMKTSFSYISVLRATTG